MKKAEFLGELRRYLEENLPDTDIEEAMEFYDGYFRQNMDMGKSEEEISGELGDPRLIGKTIVEANYKGPQRRANTERGRPKERETKEEPKSRVNLWIGICILLIAVLFLFGMAKFILFFLWPFLPVLIPAGIAVMLFRVIRKR
ncbi:MAG: DUF1700 domain-containing protein [bacterium]|nr:DUF1700 domain-containing protein [bacterium]